MKELGYRIFALIYSICRIFPISSRKIFLIMTHDAGPEGNVEVVRRYLETKNQAFIFHKLIRSDTQFGKKISKVFRFFFVVPYHMATSSYILLDNIFLPMAYMKFSKDVRVVQLWHGTGTIKRFGQSVNQGKLKEMEGRANQVTTHLIVNGDGIKKQYAQCFGMPLKKVYATGMPRTDVFFQESKQEELLDEFYKQYPSCLGKKLVLYAPTFRDGEEDNPTLAFDFQKISSALGPEYVVGLRLHPFVSKSFTLHEGLGERVIDFSHYHSLNTLLFATHVLISDYSSIVFEFAVLQRKMIFFSYDLEDYSDHGRGFYYDYASYVPGPVVTTNEEIIEEIKSGILDKEKIEAFVRNSYGYTDGKNTQRVWETIQ